jgi:hypothetical protein
MLATLAAHDKQEQACPKWALVWAAGQDRKTQLHTWATGCSAAHTHFPALDILRATGLRIGKVNFVSGNWTREATSFGNAIRKNWAKVSETGKTSYKNGE